MAARSPPTATRSRLPGVGRKTANVVMNVAFGAETFAVDTHVFRVANRTGLAPGKTVEKVEAILDRQTPQPYRRTAHHLLILHGRYVCKARRPECWRCVVRDLCRYKPKTPPPEPSLAAGPLALAPFAKRPLTRPAPVAQLDRALPSEGRGHRFESCRVRQRFWRRPIRISVADQVVDVPIAHRDAKDGLGPAPPSTSPPMP